MAKTKAYKQGYLCGTMQCDHDSDAYDDCRDVILSAGMNEPEWDRGYWAGVDDDLS